MISVADALARLLSLIEPIDVEIAPAADAEGRVLRADIVAQRAQPPFPASAMDGYAVRRHDAKPGASLRVVGELAAGVFPDRPLGPGEAMRIFTGAPLPEGADAVLLQEDARREGDAAIVGEQPEAGAWIRPAGGDFADGTTLIRAPRLLTARDVAVMASAGVLWATVARRPRVALLAMGDELRLPGAPLPPGAIVSSNNFGLAAQLRRWGATPSLPPITPDDLDATRRALRASAGADVILTLGGASDGDHDLSRPAFRAEGMDPDFYKVAMRPGKPLMAGRWGGAVVIGLPGNPVSAMVGGLVFFRPALRRLLGLPAGAPPQRIARLAAPLGANGPREHYMRARLLPEPNGATGIEVFARQDSSLLSVLSAADALAPRAPSAPPLEAGAALTYWALDDLEASIDTKAEHA